jgi:carbon catabolite-derepressing protein kinase
MLSPNALSSNGNDIEDNPFDSEFIEYDEDGELDDLDFSTPSDEQEVNNFAVLNSSLPDQLLEQHHLASYASAKRSWPAEKKKQHRTKWHFGIRSRSPPMEVMLEIYRTLKTLGMEWKEKKYLGGLGTAPHHGHGSRRKSAHGRIERAREHDGEHIDLKAASTIYFVETRCREGDVVVRCDKNISFPRPTDAPAHRFS